MYDKVKLWLERSATGEDYNAFADHLTKANETLDLQTGEVKVYGCLEGLKVSIYANGVSIIGSLSKYLYGDNINTLNRHGAKEALQKMCDGLHCNIFKADVTGLEFGTGLILSKPVEAYLQRLGTMPKMVRCHFNKGTLYYKSRSSQQPKTFAFYDKAAEKEEKGASMPVGFDGCNMLKYELRLNKRLPKQMNVREVKASTLTEEEFYISLLRRWENAYFSISKQKQVITGTMQNIRTVTDAFQLFVAMLMADSNKDTVEAFVNELRGANVFEDRKNYTRLKNKLETIADKKGMLADDELVKELDNAVKNACAYF